MNLQAFLFSLLLTCAYQIIIAQQCSFASLYSSSSGDDHSSSIVPTAENDGFYVAGGAADSVLILKLNLDGSLVWRRTLKIVYFENNDVTQMIMDSEGNLVFIGTNSGSFSVFYFKYNPVGNVVLWAKEILSDQLMQGHSILQKGHTGNYIITFQTVDSLGESNIKLMEIDKESGSIIPDFTKNYDLSIYDNLYGIVYDNNYLYGVGTYTDNDLLPRKRHTISKLDANNGNQEWVKMGHLAGDVTYSANFEGKNLMLDGNIIYSIYDGKIVFEENKIYIQKTTTDGEVIWLKKIDLPGIQDAAHEIIKSGDGYVVLASQNESNTSFVMFKISPDGEVMWASLLLTPVNSPGFYASFPGSRLIEWNSHLIFTVSGRFDEFDRAIFIGSTDLSGQVSNSCMQTEYFALEAQDVPDPEFYEVFPVVNSYDPNIESRNADIFESKIQLLSECVMEKVVAFDTSICQGETFEGYDQTGFYADTFLLNSGCDSIRTIELKVENCQPECVSVIGSIYGSPFGNERGKSLAATPQSNGIYVAGSKDDSTLLMLVDMAGSIVWAKTFDFVPNREEHIVALIVDSDGMLVLSGIGGDQGNGGSVYAFRYDPINHQILWANDYLTLARNYSFSIIQKGKDGNYIMSNNPHTSLNNDSELLELDKNTGAVIPSFSKNYHLGSSETIHDMVYDGNFLYGVGRYTDGPSASDMRNTLMKLDPDNGNQIWVKMGHIPENVSARLYGEDLIIEQGEIYSIYNGDPSGTSTINNKIYVQKTSLEGDLLWVKQYELPGNTDGVWEMIKSGSGIVILAAAKSEPMEFFLFKIDLMGQVMWAKSFQFSSIINAVTGDRGNSVLIEVGNQLVFTGIGTNPSGTTDLLLVRTDLNGETDLPCFSSESFNIPVGEINNPVFYSVSPEEFSIDPDVTVISSHVLTSGILPRHECVLSDTIHTTIQADICEGELFEGYSQSGIYSDTFLLENGCDSIRVLLLTVTPPVVTELNKNICHNESYEGYTISGTYADTFAISTGCDSIRILHLNVFACAPVIYYDLNACRSYMIDGSHMDYSEFVATYPEFSCAEISAEHVTQIPSPENKHSCTPGVNNTIAMCVGSYGSCTYSAGNPAAVLIDFSVDPHEDSLFRFSSLQFYEKAPATYTWIDGPSGPNNYPRKYGIRILKNGNEIFRNEDISTNPNWTLQTFNFIDNDLFKVEESSIFRIELLPYCPIGNGADVSAWDLDEIRIFAACAAIGDNSFIHGQVTTKEGLPVSNVQMQMALNLSFDDISTQMTDEEGVYAFADATSEPCYLKGYKNDDVLNGVSTFDLVLIQKHLLGKTLFTSLHQYIAADADRNGDINVMDLLEIQKVLLGKYSEFQRNTSWRFGALPQDMSGNVISSFQEIKGIEFQDEDTVRADFVGIKIGDINGDVQLDAMSTVIESRDSKDFTLLVEEKEIYPGNPVVMHIKSGESAEIAGIQFALDLKGMNLVSVLVGKMPVSHVNYSMTDEGMFRFSWSANESLQLAENDVIFSLLVSPVESGLLSDRLELLSEYLSPEVYSSELEILKLRLAITDDESLSLAGDFFSVEPNPFNSELKIKLNLAEEGNIKLNFYDLSGRLLHSTSKMYLPGENALVIPASQFSGTEGVIYCQLISDGYTATQKIIKLE